MSFTKNIKTDYGALGDGQVSLTNVSITSGTNTLAVSSVIFAAGDVGKAINIIGADAAGATLKTTISTFVDTQHVTLAVTASTTLTASSQRLYWGTDDSTAFTSWRTDAQAQGTTPCVLTIPAGVYCNFSISDFWIGVFDLTISMDGATLSEFSRGGTLPQAAVGVSSARLNQVNIGDTILSLVVPAQTSIFTVGTWVCLSSLEMQGFGYPPNWAFNEYHKIMAIGSGTITIDVPATFKHLTTYPVSNPGYDMGGPATLFVMDSTWDQTVVVSGGVGGGVLDCDGQVQLLARSITITNCNIGQQNGVDPTISQAIIFNDCTLHNVEVDKDITSLTLNNCTCALIVYQSVSVINSYINGGTYTNFSGTGRNMFMSGVAVTSIFNLGCLNYGATLSISAFNCSFASIGWNPQPLLLSSTLGFSSGVFRALNTDVASFDLLARGIPGTVIFWYSTGNITNGGHQATVTALWTDGSSTYMSITPSLTSPPNYSLDPDETPGALTTVGINAHPAPNVTFRNCTGCADAVDLSQAPAGAPFYSYSKRTYASDAIGTNPATTATFVWGKIVAIKVNVTAAASGVGPLNVMGSSGAACIDSANFLHQADLNFTIDLTQVGLRVITPTGSTGALGADNIMPSETLPSPKWLWMVDGIAPYVGTAIVGGSVTIEVITVQQPTDLGTVLYSLNSVW